MRVFITGDRSVNPVIAPMLLNMALQRAVATWGPTYGDLEFSTGDQAGVEAAVRYLLPASKVEFAEVPTPTTADGDHPDFDARHALARHTCDAVLVVHGDPMSSRIAKSALAAWGDDDERTLLFTGVG